MAAHAALLFSGMPQNGDLCAQFGIYRILCCDEKLLLDRGMPFPDCPNHLKLTTVWKEVKFDELIPRALDLKRNNAA
jgi:hypothetical protein